MTAALIIVSLALAVACFFWWASCIDQTRRPARIANDLRAAFNLIRMAAKFVWLAGKTAIGK